MLGWRESDVTRLNLQGGVTGVSYSALHESSARLFDKIFQYCELLSELANTPSRNLKFEKQKNINYESSLNSTNAEVDKSFFLLAL